MTSKEKEAMKKAKEALEFYSNEMNWGNGGWEGHPSDFIRNCNRGWDIAKEALAALNDVEGWE